MTETLTLTVAGITFAVTTPARAWFAELATRYEPFLSDQPPRWRVRLTQQESADSAGPGWVVHEELITRFQIGPVGGEIDLAARQAEVTVSQPAYGGSAVDRALSFILMQDLPRHFDALMLHGVALVRNGWGLAHSGRSGVGKTTTARLAAGYADVLVDENLVISLAGPQPTLLSTPFWGGSTPLEMIRRVNRQAPLRALLLPEHGPEFVLEPLPYGDAVLALLTTEKVAVERVSSAAAWLATAERLVAQVPTYRLYFRPTAELWPFLDEALNLRRTMNDER
jgi:hypothetical protein